MKEKKFETIIREINSKLDDYQKNRDKLYELIIKIFYEDAPIIVNPPDKSSQFSDTQTVEMQLKEIIGRINRINSEFGQCLQMMNNWV
jgi:predicted translin family RNA/ssDNA-binding protein